MFLKRTNFQIKICRNLRKCPRSTQIINKGTEDDDDGTKDKAKEIKRVREREMERERDGENVRLAR